MREVVLGIGISLDGYIARPNGAVDFLAAYVFSRSLPAGERNGVTFVNQG